MGRQRSHPDQRAAQITVRVLDRDLTPTGRWLVVDERHGDVAAALQGHGCEVEAWHRIAGPWCARPTPGPPARRFDGAVVRLPRTRDALRYAVERTAAQLNPGAPVLITGCNDEGIKNLPDGLMGVAHAETVDTKFHARVWKLRRTDAPVRGTTDAFFSPVRIDLPGGPATLNGAPGLFARSGLDPASAMLLRTVQPLQGDVSTILDFGCGAGALTAGALQRWPRATVIGIDADALAIAAWRATFPTLAAGAGDGWRAFDAVSRPPEGFDLIVSNPPLHRATNRLDMSVMDALIARSPDFLAPGGRLVLVTQRQRAVTRAMEAVGSVPELLSEDGRFRVWSVTHLA